MRKTFEQYDNENPEIWKAFLKYTIETINKGFDHYGAKGIFELIRWHTGVKGNDGFKINNSYAPDYARKFIERYPVWKDFFRLRELKKLDR